ncbi:MAG: hypothetical protein L3J98_05045 [Gammaproteobacteria bacterium]|nr:hypothetical protein [Gammaproteobacteria bacterium]
MLRDSALKTARTWAAKELAMSLWHCMSTTMNTTHTNRLTLNHHGYIKT